MTRKQRKRERKQKKKNQPFTKDETAILKAIGRRMSKIENPLIGIKFHCRTCAQSWEYGFDNKVVWCRECYYREGCLKDIEDFKTCRHCEVNHGKTTDPHQRHLLDAV